MQDMSAPPVVGPGTIVMPLNAARALTGVFYVLSFLATFLRLYHRIWARKLWWDDFWVVFALVSGIMTCIIWLAIVQTISSPSFSVRYFGISGMFVAHMHSLWCSKISVAVTIVRLLGDGRPRTTSKFVSFAFGVAGVTLMLQKAFICGFNFRILPRCNIPAWTGYLELSLDLSGDTWLVAAPLYILYNMNLAPNHRRLLIAIFSCGALVTATSILRACFIFTRQNLMIGIIGHLQLAVSLITSNLLVLVTYIYRKVNRSSQGSMNTPIPIPPARPPSGHNDRSTIGATAPYPSQIYSGSHVTLTTLGSSMLDPLDSNRTHTSTSASLSAESREVATQQWSTA